ncbi:MAG: cytochrome c biogenesis protein ResB [Mariprofundaceae bacterium]
MIRLLRLLGSNKAAFAGMAVLVVAVLLNNRLVEAPVWILVAPLTFLGLSLLAAILVYPRIHRQIGLLLFHLALLGIISLAAVGEMMHMRGHFEVAEGQAFDSSLLEGVGKGPWHSDLMASVAFMQGPVAVEYEPGIKRGKTFSKVYVDNDGGEPIEKTVGDDLPLVLDGYRIYSTYRKGFAPILTWIPDEGLAQTGAVHMPSYPLFVYQQENTWMPPGASEPIHLSLDLRTTMDDRAAWTLENRTSRAVLMLEKNGRSIRLEEGQVAKLAGGALRYERLVMWKGYNVFYDPTISWMFLAALLGVAGLAWHLWAKLSVQQRQRPAGRETAKLEDRLGNGFRFIDTGNVTN